MLKLGEGVLGIVKAKGHEESSLAPSSITAVDADILQIEAAVWRRSEAPDLFGYAVDLLRHPEVDIGQITIHDSLRSTIKINAPRRIQLCSRGIQEPI